MNLNQMGTKLIYTTVPLMVIRTDESISSGTGFFYNIREDKKEEFYPFLVTNYHVIKNARNIYTQFMGSNENGHPNKEKIIKVALNLDMFIIDEENDLAIIPIGIILNSLKEQNKNVFFIGIEKEILLGKEDLNKLSAIEKITFIGYPKGIFDEINNVPIVRQGITATPIWNNFQNKNEFLIDASVYPGSSGSPVFIFNEGSYSIENGIALGSRLFFVGVLSRSYEFANNQFMNLGVVIKSNILEDFILAAYKKLKLNS